MSYYIDIKKTSGEIILTPIITNEATFFNSLMDRDDITLPFTSGERIILPYGCYIEYNDQRYSLLDEYVPEYLGDNFYHYSPVFHAAIIGAKYKLFARYTPSGLAEFDFDFDGRIQDYAQLIVNALNQSLPNVSWKLGEVPQGSVLKTLTFDKTDIFSAANYIAEEYEMEWWVSGGDTVNFGKCEVGNEIVLSTSMQESSDHTIVSGGLTGITKDGTKEVQTQYLYAYGSTRNIQRETDPDGTSYNNRLQLPDGIEYVEVEGATSGAEQVVFYEDIFPKVIGTITEVKTEMSAGEDGSEYPIYFVRDKNRGFVLYDVTIPGMVPKIVFTSGRLNGREFDVNDTKETASMQNGLMEIFAEDQEGVLMPNTTFRPEIGDEYFLYNILLPKEKEVEAQQKLLAKAVADAELLSRYSPPLTCTANEIEFTRRAISLVLGSRLRIEDESLKDGFTETRLTQIEYKLVSPYGATFKTSSSISGGVIDELQRKVAELGMQVRVEKGEMYHPLRGKSYLPLDASSIQTSQIKSFDFFPKTGPGTGKGFAIYKDGFGNSILQVDKIDAEELIVEEFTYNKVSVLNGDQYYGDNGIIVDVKSVEGESLQRKITISDTEGGASTFELDDLLFGIYLDRSNGGIVYRFVKMIVLEVVEPYVLRVSLTADSAEPTPDMIVVQRGNRTNIERQRFRYFRVNPIGEFWLVNVSDFDFNEDNILSAKGDLRMYDFGPDVNQYTQMAPYSEYDRMNKVVEGYFMQRSGSGLYAPIPADRGEWKPGAYYHYDRVSHNGSLWDCAVNMTTDEPSGSTTDWTRRTDKGESVTPDGEWSHLNVPYTANSIVSFARASFIALRDTSLPPVGLLMGDDRYLMAGEKYLLRGDPMDWINDEDWMMLTPPPVNGEPGQNGTDGKDGSNGQDAPLLKVQFSETGLSGWHDTYVPGDNYRKESNDGGISWSGAMRMTGEKGPDGQKTPYSIFSYAYGIAQPSVWYDTPPEKVGGQNLWERIQKYEPKADNSGWNLVSTSYVIIDQVVSTKMFQGDFSAGKPYYNNASRQDVVKYADVFYMYVGNDAQVQNTWVAANWKNFGASFESVATDLLVAPNAVIKFMQGQQLLILGENGNIEAALSAYGDYPFWVGSNKAENAPLRYNKVTKQLIVDSNTSASARIGGLSISSGSLYNYYYDSNGNRVYNNNASIVLRDNNEGTFAVIGSAGAPSTGVSYAGMFEKKKQDASFGSINVAATFEASGAETNEAIRVIDGDIDLAGSGDLKMTGTGSATLKNLTAFGMGFRARMIYGQEGILDDDVCLMCNNTSTFTLWLPSGSGRYAGRMLYIRNMGSSSVKIRGNGALINTAGGDKEEYELRNRGAVALLVFIGDGTNNYWCLNYLTA